MIHWQVEVGELLVEHVWDDGVEGQTETHEHEQRVSQVGRGDAVCSADP